MMLKRIGHSTVTLNNRVSLPKDVLKILKLSEGDMIGFFEHQDGIMIKKMKLVDSD